MHLTELSKEKVENYLRDIPDGLYSRHVLMTDKELKDVVVRRLEQLLTGRISGRHASKKQSMRSCGSFALALITADAKTTDSSAVHEPPTLGTEPTPSEGPESTSNPKEDHTDFGGNGNNTVSGTYPPLPMSLPPEQRPTRLYDLDPHRDVDSSKNAHKFGTKLCATSESFHYQPLFVQQGASGEQTPEPVSSFGRAEGRNPG
jgi:hypothetical protein